MNVYFINYKEEAKLHYLKKFKGEFIERIEEGSDKHNTKIEVMQDIVQFLDSKIYDMEQGLRRSKENSREKEVGSKWSDYI